MEKNKSLFEHYSFIVDEGQSPLRIDKYLMNFIENATLRYIEEEEYVDDFENDEILSNKELMDFIQRGYEESIEGKGKLIDL